jgi:hypothetical protein
VKKVIFNKYILLTYDGYRTEKKWTVTKLRAVGSLLRVHKVNMATHKFYQ